ncbi:MAG: aldehyde dehydrogenase family protein [Sedimentitalea sp.]
MDSDLKSIAAARRAAETAWDAYQKFLGTDPSLIDEVVQAMSRAVIPHAKRLGEMAAEETGMGKADDKRIKNLFNSVTVADYLRDLKTLGVLWQDEKTKIAAIGEPMGVVAALIPATNPTSTIIYKVMSAVKAGNAVICAPHPRAINCGLETAKILIDVADGFGLPKGLIQCLDTVTQEGTAELMTHPRVSIIMATGGPGMVRAAHKSGKPTLAVGAGNVPCYVHGSVADRLGEVAEMILTSKNWDYGSACIAEQAIVADRPIARELRHELKSRGGYFCTAAEADRLAKVIFHGPGQMNADFVAQPAAKLARAAGISLPPNTRVLVVEESEVGWHRPLSAEKLNPVVAFYEAKDVDDGLRLSRDIVTFGGWGHSTAIHCDDVGVVGRYSAMSPVGRVIVNTPTVTGGMGFSTDIDPSFMLGTGTWSGSIVSDNVTALHLINIKRVAWANRDWREFYDVYGDI